ncbi:S41 family peptidase [Hyalangium gracile]|uniref:S41 family peptidase n=1 Tax=Hyalangium gracile TaxID=394092 RepID=UPI001CCB186D|nr:S41 family peptidase [Hyalangium gracile]
MRASPWPSFRCLVASLLIATTSTAAEPASAVPPRLSAQDLQADFALLKRAYEKLHPGLHRYNDKAAMDAHFAALRTELERDLSLQEAYLAFSRFLAKIRCGHSYLNFFNQPKAVATALFQQQNRVPFYFRWIDRRMIVTRNFSKDARLVPGTEVLSIDGTPAATILERLLTVARADGSNDAKRVSHLEVGGHSNYEAFDIYFPMFFPKNGPRMELRVKTPGGKSLTSTVEPLTYEQRLAPIQAQEETRRGGDGPLWEFKFLDSRTGYLRMPTWALYKSQWDWQGFLDTVFRQLAQRKAAHLVIDLRGNEGGMSVGDVILGKLTASDLRLQPLERRVRYRKVPEDLAPHLDTWDPSFKDWGDDAVDPVNGFYRLKRYDDPEGGNVIKASAQPFKGLTYVLVDASNSSATFEFALALRQNKLATLVGQPTGGNQRGINGGAFFFLRLPRSKLEVDLPLIGFFPLEERPDAGLVPDIEITPRVQDIARGTDTELQALMKHLARARP